MTNKFNCGKVKDLLTEKCSNEFKNFYLNKKTHRCMNVFASKGYKVYCDNTTIKRDYTNTLEVETIYTVLNSKAGENFSSITLLEFPNKTFHSMCFLEVEHQSNSITRKHPNY